MTPYTLFSSTDVLFSASALGIYVLSSDTLVEESLKAYHDGEEVCGVLFLALKYCKISGKPV